MSLENFRVKFPADPSIRGVVEGIKTRENKSGKSPFVILAEQFVKEGRDGLRTIMNRLNRSNTMFELDPKSFSNIPPEDRQEMFVCFAAIFFGTTVISLERILVEGEYDHEGWCADYSLGIQGLQIKEEKVGNQRRERLSADKLGKMLSVIKRDKTFASFFEERKIGTGGVVEENINAIPDTLKRVLDHSGALPFIRQFVLPIYNPRAKFLLAAN